MKRFAVTLAIMTVAATPAHAGIVQAFSARFEGKVVLHKDHVTVDAKKLAWNEVLYLLPDSDGKPLTRSQRVNLKNGESWAVELVGLADKKLDVRSDLFGQKQIDVRLVAALEFALQPFRQENSKQGVLYRVKGEPISGKLLSLTPDKLRIDSVVGELDLPRTGLIGYRFADEKPARDAGHDDVGLIDGSRFLGKLQPGADGYLLEHKTLGKLTLPTSIIRSVVRHPVRMFDLAEGRPVTLKATPLLATRNAELVAPSILDGAVEPTPRFVRGMLFEPNLTAEYQVPGMGDKKGRMRLMLLPMATAVGDARLRIKIKDKVVLERDISPNTKAEAVSFDVAGGDVLEIAVEFGATLRFPCGVVLGDPHVIWD